MENWKLNFEKLKSVYEVKSHFMVDDNNLNQFVADIFKLSHSNKLTAEQIGDLASIDFDFTARGKNWERWWLNYSALLLASKTKPVSSISQLDKEIGTWISAQRVSYRQGVLSNKKIALLEAIGFKWNPIIEKEKVWEDNFTLLKKFGEDNGHFSINKENTDVKFCSWVYAQKTAYRKKTIKPERVKMLKSIGFI
jgi:hypothetical protein